MEVKKESFEMAAKMYGRSLENMEEDVDILDEWIRTQPHLPEIMDKDYIRNFLISNKFSIERAKKKVDNYYTMMSIVPDVFEKRNPRLDVMKDTLDTVHAFPLPKQTSEFYRVFYMKIRDSKIFEDLSLNNVLSQVQNSQEIRLKEDCMLGDIIIADFEETSLNVLLKVTPTFLATYFSIYDVSRMH